MNKAFDYWFDFIVRDFNFYMYEKRLKNGKIETKYFWEQYFFDTKGGTLRLYCGGFDDNGIRYIMGSTLVHAEVKIDKDGDVTLHRDENENCFWEFTLEEEDFDPRDERLYHLIYVRGKDAKWGMSIDEYQLKDEPYEYCI